MDDPNYRRLFAFPRMVKDLLRAVGDTWVDDIEFSTLERLQAEYVGDLGQQRRGDAVWRVRFRDGWLHLLILLEFQSRPDPVMALRVLEYTALLYRELHRAKASGPPGRWPAVLPVVLYNGDEPWNGPLELRDLIAPVAPGLAPGLPSQRSLLLDEQRMAVDDIPARNMMRAVAGLEQSQSAEDTARVFRAAVRWMDAEDPDFVRALWAVAADACERIRPEGADALRVDMLEDAKMSFLDRMGEWPAQWQREGFERGIEQGIERGIEQQRDMVRHQSAVRFGDAAAAQVAALLEDADADGLATAAEWVVRCETGDELVRRLEALPAGES